MVQADMPKMAVCYGASDIPQMAVCYGASTLRKATNKRSEYVIFIACPLQLWLCERASMLRLQVYCLSCSITLRFEYVLLGISPASNCSWPTFRNPVSVPSSKAGGRL